LFGKHSESRECFAFGEIDALRYVHRAYRQTVLYCQLLYRSETELPAEQNELQLVKMKR